MDDGTRYHAVTTLPSGGLAIGYRQPGAGGEPLELVVEFSSEPDLGDEGIPRTARLAVAGRGFTVTPLAWSPVLLEHPDGREARFPRAMANFDADDGAHGIGWIEFNQPPG